ncbi:uncharacterized protein [Rutidosis leptorrhynchoides]|uniref:uncharacterized protein n=1 Tax=Rutidosis leptorrhynchoides TaxID=125765 RepID=UPI003A98ED57
MTGVPREIAEHKLNANPSLTPVRQKKRGMAPERSEWLKAKVDKLVKANILREVRYQMWVANPVLVKKPDGSWRYHQIQMATDDEDKIAFYTSQGIYCYTKMPFGLKKCRSNIPMRNRRGFQSAFLEKRKESFWAIITERGIRANPKKIKAIESMPSPRNKKEVQSLTGIELKYPAIEKLVYALVHTARRLRRYFQAHPIMVLTDQPIKQITHVSRTLNKKADALSKLAALTFSHFKKEIWVEELKVKSIETDGVSAAVEEEEQSRMTPIVEFLNKGTLPIDSIEARKIKMKAPMYLLDKEILYRKSFLGPHLRCLNPTQAESIIREVHEGMCTLHSGHKTVVSKIMRLEYYWTSMYRDAAEVICKCQSCQLHAPVSKAPRHLMIPVASPWPFCKWVIDIVGPFPAGPGGVKFLVVAIDYFTKWVESKPLKNNFGQANLKFRMGKHRLSV